MRAKTGQQIIFWTLAVTLVAVLPAVAQEPALQTDDSWVTTDDGFSIHVMRRFMEGRKKVAVLLVHAIGGNSKTWDFPGRSVMDYLAVRGYDVYALDLRGMWELGTSHPYTFFDSSRKVDEWDVPIRKLKFLRSAPQGRRNSRCGSRLSRRCSIARARASLHGLR